ncbi:hypothetical protein UFOVP1009_1, partial [uncultured Caudovirales phage]
MKKHSIWESIETAPRDGTAIIGYQALNHRSEPDIKVWMIEVIYFNTFAQSWRVWDFFSKMMDEEVFPTHWMHMPEPPIYSKPQIQTTSNFPHHRIQYMGD